MLLVLIALSLPVRASDWNERDKPVICGPFQEIVRTLMKEQYQELPLWIGQSSQDKTQFSLFTNQRTGSWTLIQYGTTTGCILGVGNTSDIVNLSPFKEKQ